jgi:hypothetical protein
MLHDKILTLRDAEILNTSRNGNPSIYLNLISNKTKKAVSSIKLMANMRPLIDCVFAQYGETYYGRDGGLKTEFIESRLNSLSHIIIGKPTAGYKLTNVVGSYSSNPEMFHKFRRYLCNYRMANEAKPLSLCIDNTNIREVCKRFETEFPYKVNLFMKRSVIYDINSLELLPSYAHHGPIGSCDMLIPLYGKLVATKPLSQEKVIITL